MSGKAPALFLDRDGIINVDKGYVYRWEDIVWFEETIELIKRANNLGFKVIVLTNQSGVDKGKYQENDVILLHQKMNQFLNSKNAIITDWYYCIDSDGPRRKPNAGMLMEAAQKHSIDLSLSIMIGDKVSDIFQVDSPENRPQTFIVKGAYDLSTIEKQCPPKVSILNDHKEMLSLVSAFISRS